MIARRLFVWLPLVLALVLAVVFVIALNRPNQAPTIATMAVDLTNLPVPAFALDGAPDALPHAGEVTGLTDQDVAVGENGLALVNFFASWCAPCRIEHPFLMRLAREGEVALYGIAYRDTAERASEYLVDAGNPFRQVGLDPDGDAALGFGITGMPETFLIDADGRIRLRIQGPVSGPQFDQLLETIALLEQETGS